MILCLAVLISNCNTSRKTTGSAKPSSKPDSREMTVRKDIVAYAAKYKGSKYTPAGKKPDTGFDCSGFTSYVFNHYEISLSPAAREQVKQV